jgi:hypothetical protein
MEIFIRYFRLIISKWQLKTLFPIALMLIAGCASQISIEAYNPPGFFMGFIHGLIVPFSFIGSLFSPDIRIYAFPNAGRFYDYGFIIGFAISSLMTLVIADEL